MKWTGLIFIIIVFLAQYGSGDNISARLTTIERTLSVMQSKQDVQEKKISSILSSVLSQISTNDRELRTMTSELATLKRDQTTMKNDITSLRNSLKTTDKRLNQTLTAPPKTSNAVINLTKSYNSLKADLASKIYRLELTVNSSRTQILTKFGNELKNAENNLTAKQTFLTQLQNHQIQRAVKNISDIYDNLKTDLNNRLTVLETSLNNSKVQTHAQLQSINNTHGITLDLQIRLNTFRSSVSTVEQHLSAIESQVNSTSSDSRNLSFVVDQLKHEARNLSRQYVNISDLEPRTTSLEAVVNSTRKKQYQTDAQMIRLDTNVTDQQTQLTSFLSSWNHELTALNQSYSEVLSVSHTTDSTVKALISDVNNQRYSTQRQLQVLSGNVSALLQWKQQISNQTSNSQQKVPSSVAFAVYGTPYGYKDGNSSIPLPRSAHIDPNCYDKQTGKFTAPVQGRYFFWVHVYNYDPHRSVSVTFHTGNFVKEHEPPHNYNANPLIIQTVAELSVRGKVWFTLRLTSPIKSDKISVHFGGFLIP